MRVPLLALLPLASCAFSGPGTVARDRFDYVAAISRSQDEQMLLNLVRARYAETPMFLDVGRVVSSYEFAGDVGATMNNVGLNSDTLQLRANARFSERPTITYEPVDGQRFDQVLITPIPPGAILFLVEAGWQPELVLRMTVDSVNGFRNRSHLAYRDVPGDEIFERFVSTLTRRYGEGSIGFRLERNSESGYSVNVLLRDEQLSEADRSTGRALRAALGLPAEGSEFQVIYGPPDGNPSTVNVLTRPLLQMLNEQSAGVEVPPEHQDGRALPARHGVDMEPLIRVHSGDPGDHVFVAVRYRGTTFWIDDRDLASKQAFGFLVLLFHVMAAGPDSIGPILTIPT